jgi:hypothetical protein
MLQSRTSINGSVQFGCCDVKFLVLDCDPTPHDLEQGVKSVQLVVKHAPTHGGDVHGWVSVSWPTQSCPLPTAGILPRDRVWIPSPPHVTLHDVQLDHNWNWQSPKQTIFIYIINKWEEWGLTATICIGYGYKTWIFADKFIAIVWIDDRIIIQMITDINCFTCICIACITIFFNPTNKI